jgi:hypothetical protein
MERKTDNVKRESGVEDMSVDEAQQDAIKGGERCGLIQKFTGGDVEGDIT